MQQRFVINSFVEQPMQYNTDFIFTPEVLQDINIRFALLLKYREQSDMVGVQVDLMYTHQEQRILIYSAMLTLQDFEWLAFLQTQPDEEQIREFALLWFEYAFNFLRGALAVNAKNTPAQKLFLPVIDTNSCKSFIQIDKVTDK